MSEPTSVPARRELPQDRTWNATSLYSDRNDWRRAADELEGRIKGLEQFKGTLADGPGKLLTALQAKYDLLQESETVELYAGMEHYCDTTDAQAVSMHSRAQALDAQARSAAAFIEPEILGIGRNVIEAWLEQDQGLAMYRHYLLDLFRRAEHVRSDDVEELLGLVQAPFAGVSATATMLINADFEFEPAQDQHGQEHEVTVGTINRLLQSPDRKLRGSARQSFDAPYYAHKSSMSNNLLTSVQQSVFKMKARRHESTLQAALFDDAIETDVFHSLQQAFDENREIWHRYFEVRRRALGLEVLQPYDIWAPLTSDRPDLSYEQAVDWICEGLAPMGEEYVTTVRRGCLEERWVDVYPNQGKRAGAFSTGTKGTHPFIMMSFNGTILNLSTLAHELGHSMHSYYARRNQPMVYSDYSLFAAEVASNFHQAMVRAHLLEQADERDLEIALLEEAFSNFHRYLLIMPTLARFELEVHERLERGEGLNVDDLMARCVDLFAAAYGEAMDVNSDNMGLRWAQFTHLYRDYYVFQYATGISAANALANRILSGDEGAVDDYLGFLKAGGSEYPLAALRQAGVDMTRPEPVATAFEVLSGMVDRLEARLG